MRRRANSGSKSDSNHNSTTHSTHPTTIEMTATTIQSSPLTPTIHNTRKRRTHSEMERGSASFSSSARSSIALAAEKVASTIDFDLLCSSNSNQTQNVNGTPNSPCNSSSSSNSSVDEEKRPLLLLGGSKKQQQQQQQHGERQSLLQQNQDQELNYQRSQLHLEQQQQQRQSSSSSFPHIDMPHIHLPSLNDLQNMNLNNLNLPHIEMNMQNLNLPHIENLHLPHIEDFDFDNLPVEIQVALEDTLLGWTHLTSITIGHVLLPWLVFCAVQRASKYVLEQTVYTWNTNTTGNSNSLLNDSAAGGGDAVELEMAGFEAVLVAPMTHALLGAVAAIAAFRVIRHRRRVWFKHAYGSEGYKRCEEGRRRREAVLRADKGPTSLLSLSSLEENNVRPSWSSRVVSNYKRKRHKKKLRQASDRFERHHTGLSPKNQHHVSYSTTKSRFRPHDYESTSVAPTEDDYDSSSSSEDGGTMSPDRTTSPINNNNNTINTGSKKSSIAHDAVSIPRIHNVPYAHGGFFGAAPFFLADKFWVTILRELLPDVYVEISRRVGGSYYYHKLVGGYDYRSDASKLIHWAENNPVVAAYGVVMDLQIKQELATTNPTSSATADKLAKPKALSKSHRTGSGNIIDHFYQQTHQGICSELQNSKSLGGGKDAAETPHTEAAKAQGETAQEAAPSMVIPNLEWDIFVDPQLVRRVEAVLDSMNRYVASKKEATATATSQSTDKEFGHDVPVEPDDGMVDDEDHGKSEAAALLADHDHNISTTNAMSINNLCGSGPSDVCTDCFQATSAATSSTHVSHGRTNALGEVHTEAEEEDDLRLPDHLINDPVLRYLERELEKRTQELTDRLLIAHGNVLQLVMEQSGVLKDWNYSRVQRTRRTLGGGMYARQWMAVFAEALRLGMRGPQKNACNSSSNCKAKGSGGRSSETTAKFNFYDEDDGDSTTGMGETEALLSPLRNENAEEEDLLERDRDDPLGGDHDGNLCSCSPRCCLDTTIKESLQMIEKITQTKQPVGILLDLKSRHVPKRVLSLIVQYLQAAGIRVVGIASFEISDIRGVCSQPHHHFSTTKTKDSKNTTKIPLGIPPSPVTTPTKEILMVHSAGDLQAACDEGLVRPGDHVFFNGGSLILDSARSSTIKSLLGFFFDMCVCGYYNTFDPCAIEDGYRIQSYGYACNSMDAMDGCFPHEARDLVGGSNITTTTNSPVKRKTAHGLHPTVGDLDVGGTHGGSNDEDTLLLSPSSFTDEAEDTDMGAVMRTLADYKKHYGFSMGLYLQEFSIDEAAARLLIDLVNENPQLYDLGLAWGGINGMTVHGIQPGRFTSTDGYWNQRRLGKTWKSTF